MPATRAETEALDWLLRQQEAGGNAEGLDLWLAADPANRRAWQAAQAMWHSPAFASAAGQAEQRLRRRRPSYWRGYAALAALLLLTAFGAGWSADLPLRLQADHVTATGETRQVKLGDGSVITLDSSSAASLSMTATGRQVRLLKGNAFSRLRPMPAALSRSPRTGPRYGLSAPPLPSASRKTGSW